MFYFIRLFWLSIFIFCFSSPLLASSSTNNVILKEIGGKDISLNSLKGKWVFINYWAGWCQPCVEEIAALNRFYENNKQKVAVFAFNFDNPSVKQQLKLIKEHKITYSSLLNDPAKPLHLTAVVGLPTTFVLNPEGKLVRTLFGPQTLSSLNKVIR